ncbi:MAG: DUF86 domain-containing protein [Planctomycetia bacterium]|nr:DUF86 domain-containing protein [Planctomycetia bacterium]
MPHDDSVYLGHMLDTARKAVSKVSGKTRADFDADEDLRIVLAHLVQVIGEASTRVSAKSKTAHPQIPWRRISGMRHRIVHDYMDINDDVLWQVATANLPELVNLLESIVSDA